MTIPTPALDKHFKTAGTGAGARTFTIVTDKDGTLLNNNHPDMNFLAALIALQAGGDEIILCSKGPVDGATKLALNRKHVPAALNILGAGGTAPGFSAIYKKQEFLSGHSKGADLVFDDEPVMENGHNWSGARLHIVPKTKAFNAFKQLVLESVRAGKKPDLETILPAIAAMEGAYTPERPYAGTAPETELAHAAAPGVAA